MKNIEKIKVAILGYGVVGKKRHDSMIKSKAYEVLAISDKDFKINSVVTWCIQVRTAKNAGP